MLPESWKKRKVLVTGAQGFLGSHVAGRLATLGAETHGFVRRDPLAGDRIRWLTGDLSDSSTVRRALREIQPDVVFHLAGHTSAAPDKELILPSLLDNLTSTVVLLRELVDVGCQRVVVTASLEEPEAGASEVVPTSPYGASKWAEAGYARMFHALYQVPVVLVRPYMTYGPRQRATKLIPSLTLSLLRGESPTLAQPDRDVDWIYVDDVVDGILAAGVAPGVEGRTVDLGSGVLLPIREMAETLRRVVGSGATLRVSRPEKSAGVHGRRADTGRARKLLGWTAATSLEQGLERTVAWFRAHATDSADTKPRPSRGSPTKRN